MASVEPNANTAPLSVARNRRIQQSVGGFTGDINDNSAIRTYMGSTEGGGFQNISDMDLESFRSSGDQTNFWSNIKNMFGSSDSGFIPTAGVTNQNDLNFANQYNTDLKNNMELTKQRFDNFANVTQGVASLGNLYMGYKNYGIAKDTLKFQKQAYAQESARAKQQYNTELERRREISESIAGTYSEKSMAEYMDKHGLK